MTTDGFIENSKKVHGNRYNYSLTSYSGSNNKVKIICPIHGLIEQRAYNHLNGIGCKKCADDKLRS